MSINIIFRIKLLKLLNRQACSVRIGSHLQNELELDFSAIARMLDVPTPFSTLYTMVNIFCP